MEIVNSSDIVKVEVLYLEIHSLLFVWAWEY